MCNVGLQAKKEYDSDDEEDAKKTEVVEDPGTLNDEYRWCLSLDCEILSIFLSAALQMATATDIQDIADILGVTFQEHCSATPLKVFCIIFESVFVFVFLFAFVSVFVQYGGTLQ